MSELVILIIRHGHRLDEDPNGPDFLSWMSNTENRWYDPPLTSLGKQQAKQAGHHLASLIFSRRLEPSTPPALAASASRRNGRPTSKAPASQVTLLVSPLLRTLQTAEEMVAALPGATVQVVPGLCECAAAVAEYGLQNLKVLSEEEIQVEFPRLPLAKNSVPSSTLPQTFNDTLKWLVRQGPGQYILVSHREGINSMFSGSRLPTPYCCFARFELLPGDSRFRLTSLTTNEGQSIPFQQNSRVPRALKADSMETSKGRRSSSSSASRSGSSESYQRKQINVGVNTGQRAEQKTAQNIEIKSSKIPPPKDYSALRKQTKKAKDTAHPETDEYSLKESERKNLKSESKDAKKNQAKPQPEQSSSLEVPISKLSLKDSTLKERKSNTVASKQAIARTKNFPKTGFQATNKAGPRQQRRGKPAASMLHLVPKGQLYEILCFLTINDLGKVCCVCRILKEKGSDDRFWCHEWDKMASRAARAAEKGKANPADASVKWNINKNFKSSIYAVLCGRQIYLGQKVLAKVKELNTKSGVVHAYRKLTSPKFSLGLEISAKINGSPATFVETVRKQDEKWVEKANLVSTPISEDGLRKFTLSSTFKIDLATQTTVADITSFEVCIKSKASGKEFMLVNIQTFIKMDWRAHFFCLSDDRSLSFYKYPVCSPLHSNSFQGMVCIAILKSGSSLQPQSSDGVSLLSLHLPHGLVCNDFFSFLKKDVLKINKHIANPSPVMTACVCLRTMGVPLFEAILYQVEPKPGTLRLDLFGSQGFARDSTRELNSSPDLTFKAGAFNNRISNTLIFELSLWDLDQKNIMASSNIVQFEMGTLELEAGYVDFDTEEDKRSQKRGFIVLPDIGTVGIELCKGLATGNDTSCGFMSSRNSANENQLAIYLRKLYVDLSPDFFRSCFTQY